MASYRKCGTILVSISIAALLFIFIPERQRELRVGDIIDSHNGIEVYYNGKISNVSGRNLTPDGYNIGQQYQCVEFIKRYYLHHLNHRMPDPYGHAKDFFNPYLADGEFNERRALVQYKNGGAGKPAPDDILVLAPSLPGGYGHVGIITEVAEDRIEIIEQNTGRRGKARSVFGLSQVDGVWHIQNSRVLGWLRKEEI